MGVHKTKQMFRNGFGSFGGTSTNGSSVLHGSSNTAFHQCPICHAKFNSSVLLHQHMFTDHTSHLTRNAMLTTSKLSPLSHSLSNTQASESIPNTPPIPTTSTTIPTSSSSSFSTINLLRKDSNSRKDTNKNICNKDLKDNDFTASPIVEKNGLNGCVNHADFFNAMQMGLFPSHLLPPFFGFPNIFNGNSLINSQISSSSQNLHKSPDTEKIKPITEVRLPPLPAQFQTSIQERSGSLSATVSRSVSPHEEDQVLATIQNTSSNLDTVKTNISSEKKCEQKEDIPNTNSDNNKLALQTPLHAIQKMYAEAVNESTSPPRQMLPLSKHQCRVCRKHFSSSSALQIHMRTHTGTHESQQNPSRRGRRIFDFDPNGIIIGESEQQNRALAAAVASGVLSNSASNPLSRLTDSESALSMFGLLGGNNLDAANLRLQMEAFLMVQNTCPICHTLLPNTELLQKHIKEHLIAGVASSSNNPDLNESLNEFCKSSGSVNENDELLENASEDTDITLNNKNLSR